MTAAARSGDEAEPRINLSRARSLLVDASQSGLVLMSQLLSGLGMGAVVKAPGSAAAQKLLATEPFDLVVADSLLGPECDGFDLVRRLRRDNRSPNQQVAVILLCGHTPMSQVRKARDCGVSLLIAKPVSAGVVAKRIQWLARDRRDFVDCGEIYVGPDRRFHDQPEPPEGRPGRRRNDPAPTPPGDPA